MAEKDEPSTPGRQPPSGQQMVFPTIGDPEAEKRQAEEERQRGEQPPEGDEHRQEPPQQPATDEGRAKELERQLEEMRERERRMQATVERLAAQPPQQPPQQQPSGADDDAEIEKMIADLPDPVNSPKDYNRKMLEITDRRAEKRAREIAQTSTEDQTRQTQAQQLWDRFQGRHKDLASYDLVVQGVYQREAQRLRQMGVDPIQYAMTDPDGFVDRVAEQARGYLTERGVKVGQESDPSAGGGGGGGAGGGAPATAGIDGAAPRAPSGQGGRTQEQPKGFVEQLKEEQVKSGFF